MFAHEQEWCEEVTIATVARSSTLSLSHCQNLNAIDMHRFIFHRYKIKALVFFFKWSFVWLTAENRVRPTEFPSWRFNSFIWQLYKYHFLNGGYYKVLTSMQVLFYRYLSFLLRRAVTVQTFPPRLVFNIATLPPPSSRSPVLKPRAQLSLRPLRKLS